jgi:NAD(P)-dependent dehydrogenase (short-subunit alcohol dehydrogenase family)
VNVIAPGVVRTNIHGSDKTVDDFNGIAEPAQLIQRAGTVEEVAKFVCFLLSDDASFITGSIQAIDGGALLKM